MAMARMKMVVAVVVGAGALFVGFGCSHEQKVAERSTPSSPVAARPTPPPRAARPPAPEAAPVAVRIQDAAIFFDFDSSLLRGDARSILQKLADDLRGKDKEQLAVEGNCDELGTVEYNMALGDQRARVAKEYLVHLGVAPERIRTLSYGATRPRYSGHDESSRARNRRDDLVVR